MVYLILGVICVAAIVGTSVVLLVRHLAARRKITIFLNGEEVPEGDWHMAPDRVPVFHFPVRPNSECFVVRGDGTRTVAPMIRVRMQVSRNRAVEPFVRLDPPNVTGVDANALARQLQDALRHPDLMPPMPDMPPMPTLVRPGITVREVTLQTVETRSTGTQEPAQPRFDRELDINDE